MGQKRKVIVRRLFVKGSVEEKIMEVVKERSKGQVRTREGGVPGWSNHGSLRRACGMTVIQRSNQLPLPKCSETSPHPLSCSLIARSTHLGSRTHSLSHVAWPPRHPRAGAAGGGKGGGRTLRWEHGRDHVVREGSSTAVWAALWEGHRLPGRSRHLLRPGWRQGEAPPAEVSGGDGKRGGRAGE